MLTRRDVLKTTIGAVLVPGDCRAQAPFAGKSFDELFAEALSDPDTLELTRMQREGQIEQFEYFATKSVAPRYVPSATKLDQKAVDLIVAFEVTSQSHYTKKLHGPIWPKGESGVTIGIGYDLGYVKPDWLKEDWSGILTDPVIGRLSSACKINGIAAKDMLTSLHDIAIEWSQAHRQFTTTSLPRYTAEALDVLPNTGELPPKCLGALVSLIYNRGASFKTTGPRYAEMRRIRLHMVKKQFSEIPGELRSMKKIWEDDPDLKGLLVRRELEAKLFEEGLAAG